MARSLRAFVSYRRSDAFMQGPDPGKPSRAFIEELESALKQLGFTKVFVDTSEIKAGDYFEGRIHKAILNCDLFISLIGREWLHLLDAKIKTGEPDILERELATAFTLEKDVVPLLVDGAKMPGADDLPDGLKQLADIDGKDVASDASAETIAKLLQEPVQEASEVRKLGRGWTTGYVLFSVVVWILSAIVPNAVGLLEFGSEPWMGMATAWSGMFIWPIFFLPFILLALYRPFRIILEATLNAESTGDAVKYASPVLLGTIIALLMTVSEISAPQVPWTIHPNLGAECSAPADKGPNGAEAIRQYDEDRRILATYGAAVPAQQRHQFWMKDKCWPNVFFYSAALPRAALAAMERGSAQERERTNVYHAFLRMLGKDSKAFKGTDAPYSTLFPFYALAFFLMVWLLASAILMAIIYATISIRRPRDGRVLRVPNEDAFLCLTYGFVTLLNWVPFRMTTNSIKFSYYCAGLDSTCGPVEETFNKDFGLGLALLAGYTALTVGMLWNHHRLLLGFLGTLAVSVISAAAVAAAKYHDTLSLLTEYWQFWLAVSLLASIMLVALWYQYDPAIVRFKDFQGSRRVRKAPT